MKTLKHIAAIVFAVLIQVPNAFAGEFKVADFGDRIESNAAHVDSSADASPKLIITESDLDRLQELEIEEEPEEKLDITGTRYESEDLKMPLNGLTQIDEPEEEIDGQI